MLDLKILLNFTHSWGFTKSLLKFDCLLQMRSMLTYLEAARYKVQNALADIEGQTKISHPLASHIQMTRDRQGLQQSILKVCILKILIVVIEICKIFVMLSNI